MFVSKLSGTQNTFFNTIGIFICLDDIIFKDTNEVEIIYCIPIH